MSKKKTKVKKMTPVDIPEKENPVKERTNKNINDLIDLFISEQDNIDSFFVIAHTDRGVILSSEGDAKKLIPGIMSMVVKEPNIGKMLLEGIAGTMNYVVSPETSEFTKDVNEKKEK